MGDRGEVGTVPGEGADEVVTLGEEEEVEDGGVGDGAAIDELHLDAELDVEVRVEDPAVQPAEREDFKVGLCLKRRENLAPGFRVGV